MTPWCPDFHCEQLDKITQMFENYKKKQSPTPEQIAEYKKENPVFFDAFLSKVWKSKEDFNLELVAQMDKDFNFSGRHD